MDGQEILSMSDDDFLAQMGTMQEAASATSTESTQTHEDDEVTQASEAHEDGAEVGAADAGSKKRIYICDMGRDRFQELDMDDPR